MAALAKTQENYFIDYFTNNVDGIPILTAKGPKLKDCDESELMQNIDNLPIYLYRNEKSKAKDILKELEVYLYDLRIVERIAYLFIDPKNNARLISIARKLEDLTLLQGKVGVIKLETNITDYIFELIKEVKKLHLSLEA